LEIYSFDELASTQTKLIEELKRGFYKTPSAVITSMQSDGVGSRDNSWVGAKGNFFASIAIDISSLPSDLPIASSSIYFSWIMRDVLVKDFDLDVWLKWPNDFYYNNQKVGGTVTKKINNIMVCGIGINIKNSEIIYESLSTDISANDILERFINRLLEYPEWNSIFNEYKIEFERSRDFFVHIDNIPRTLKQSSLCEDGSLIVDGERIFSLR